ncbi:MAG: hypothetical protein R6W82_05250 [bacterium]
MGRNSGAPTSSWNDHRILFDRLMGDETRSRNGRVVPSSVFTDPQVGRVGLNETEAREQGEEYEAAAMPWGHIARALVDVQMAHPTFAEGIQSLVMGLDRYSLS